MSSVNPHFTFHYEQPDGYRFSHDSVFLARRVFERGIGKIHRMLDLCAGCGVVGLDFLFHQRKAERPLPRECEFLEVQDVYAPYFARNAAGFAAARFRHANYAQLLREEERARFDLILCNPPYFRLGQGRVSPNDFKNRCRFFIDSDFTTLVRAIDHTLAPGGRAFVLLHGLGDHGVNVEREARAALSSRIRLAGEGEIRGTPLVRFEAIR